MADDGKDTGIIAGVKSVANSLDKTYNPIRAVSDAISGEPNKQSVWGPTKQVGDPVQTIPIPGAIKGGVEGAGTIAAAQMSKDQNEKNQ